MFWKTRWIDCDNVYTMVLKESNCTILRVYLCQKSVLSFVLSIVTIGKAFRSISFQRSFGIGSDVQIILSRIVLTRTLEISKVSKFTCIRYRLTWVSRLGIQSYKKVFIWILNGMNDRKRVMTKFVIITLYHIDIFQTFVIIDYIFGKLISCVFLEL